MDGRTDGQTVRQTESIMAKTALCIASYADALSKILMEMTMMIPLSVLLLLLLAHGSIYAIACYMPSPFHLSVRPSVTRVDQLKLGSCNLHHGVAP